MRVAAAYDLDEMRRAKLERISTAIIQGFVGGGYERVALPVLQPADLYLDMAGEDIRERMFVFDDPAGNELCLRADLTIPLCRFVLDRHSAFPARRSCLGPVFRFDTNAAAPTEMLQAGIECLGGSGIATDIEVLDLARAALAATGADGVEIVLGDVSLFPALLADLAIDEIWQRQLAYAFRHPSLLGPTLADMRAGRRPKLRSFAIDFAAIGEREAEAFVSQRVGLAEGEAVGGRTAVDIAARLIDRAKAAATPLPDARALDIIDSFLSVDGPADTSIRRLKGLTTGSGFAMTLARFEDYIARARTKLNAADTVKVSTTLGRSFVYYTGFVFSLLGGADEPLATGGRYDRLLRDLGAQEPTAAVGCAIWPERILGAQEARRG